MLRNTFSPDMTIAQAKRLLRGLARAVWWMLTPWKYKVRVDYVRVRTESRRRSKEMVTLARLEAKRRKLRAQGRADNAWPAVARLDVKALARLAGVPAARLRIAVPAPGTLTNQRAAAAFVLDLWRRRPEVRQRYDVLFRGDSEAFLNWLREEGRAALSLTDGDLAQIAVLFRSDYAERARQLYLSQPGLRELLPHGLTPPGMPSLFRWFMQIGVKQGIDLEEVFWLFLGASQGPVEELLSAHAFTPAWQRQHPDGTTVFGRDAFAQWFAQEYVVHADWLRTTSDWPSWMEADAQVRTSYWARESWRIEQPNAFDSMANAEALLDWLASSTAPISDEARGWCAANKSPTLAASLAAVGMNVIGHFTYPSGLRVSVESLVHGSKAAGIGLSLRDVRTDAKDDPHHADFRGTECYDVTVIHVQPAPYFDEAYDRADLSARDSRTYRIAYWYWEFDNIPQVWSKQAANVDEVWAATEFVAKGLRELLSLPVCTLFPGVRLARFTQQPREYFGLKSEPYTFLFTFHMMSVMERKNPLGLIQAFRAAFKPEEPVCLVLKTSFGDRYPTQLQELHDAAQGVNIQIIDAVYSRDDVLSLMDTCDAYVSLHRSEGLGLTMAEAMLMGKPVIATGYSGNVDFMDDSNSLLVPYVLKKLDRPIPPYDADSEWAEPSLSHAAQAMRRLFDDRIWASELGRRGQISAQQSLSLESAGRKVAQRLEEIRRERAGRCR